MSQSFLLEAAREIPVQESFDVIVCGAGPAGIAAAIASSRQGARTCLIEHQGCLGGIWTSGLLSLILDAKRKPGIIAEIRERLRHRGAIAEGRDLYDAEEMKLLLEEMCAEAGVAVRLHSRVVAADVQGRRIRHAMIEAREGRVALAAKCFVDASGEGDLSALAGCGFDLGRAADGLMQPMSLMALLAGVPAGVRKSDTSAVSSSSCIPKDEFLRLLREAGMEPSYTKPSLFPLPNGLCALMTNHQYGKSGLDSRDLTIATMAARREIHDTVQAMRKFPGDWSGLRLVATAAHIGVREGRRVHGLYRVTAEDIRTGARHEDAITRVSFPVDVHSVERSEGGGYSAENISNTEHYDVPLRALIARDAENLLLAGRCISGDFHAHASYRVTGNAVATGEAAGTLASLAAQGGESARDIPASAVLEHLDHLRSSVPA